MLTCKTHSLFNSSFIFSPPKDSTVFLMKDVFSATFFGHQAAWFSQRKRKPIVWCGTLFTKALFSSSDNFEPTSLNMAMAKDLTPCDFFLWGYLKSRVYRTQPADLNELRTRIEHEFAVMPQDMVQRSIDSYQRRLQKCIQVKGGSVELT